MYKEFFGLREKPFELPPDTDYVYMSRGHRNVYDHLAYAVSEGKGFAIVTGEIGSGKTTLLKLILRGIPSQVRTALIPNTGLPRAQGVPTICRDLEIDVADIGRVELLEALNDYLVRQHLEGNRVILMVDEAQNLREETIEEMRLLSNLDSEKHHLLQIILVGQPELRDKLRSKKMAQFLQRVTVHCHLRAMEGPEVRGYILHRLRIAGAGERALFEDEAIEAIARYSKGLPRVINHICDTALVFAFGEGRTTVSAGTIEDVISAREEGGLFLSLEETAGEGPEGNNGSANLLGRMASIESELEGVRNDMRIVAQNMQVLAKRENTMMELLKKISMLAVQK